MKKNLYLLFVLIFIVSSIFAQSQSVSDQSSGLIIYAEGTGFDVIHEGEITFIDLTRGDDPFGIEFFKGDIVNTYDETFIEVQLTPSQNMVKISENTSFTVRETDSSGGGSFELNYGRVRAKVTKLFGAKKFQITSPSVIAGVRGTDFGCNVIAEKGSGGVQISEVFCFEGSVAVQLAATDMAAKESGEVIIKAGEMAREEKVKVGEGEPSILTVKTITPEIKRYWNIHDFKGSPRTMESSVETPVPAVAGQIKDESTEMQRRERFKKAAIWMGTAGLITEAAGVLIFFSGDIVPALQHYDTTPYAGAAFISGGVWIGGSILSLLGLLTTGN